MRWLAACLIAFASSACATPRGDGRVCKFAPFDDGGMGAVCPAKGDNVPPARMVIEGDWMCMKLDTLFEIERSGCR